MSVRPSVALTVVIVLGLGACSRSSSTASRPPTDTAPPVVSPSASSVSTAMLPSTTAGVFAKACEAPCSDGFARLQVYRDASNAIGVVTVQGSPNGCSHPPLRFFGPDGRERATIPMKPVTPGSPEAKHFADVQAAQLAGLEKAETMLCRDVKH